MKRVDTARIRCEILQHILAALGRNTAGRVRARIRPAIGRHYSLPTGNPARRRRR